MEKIPNKPTIKSGTVKYNITIPKHVEHPPYTAVALKAKRAREITVLSNHYNLKFNSSNIYQWNAKFSPDLEGDSRKIIDNIFMANHRDIISSLGSYIRASNCIFTFQLPKDKEDVKLFTFDNHPDFKVTLSKLDKNLNFDSILSMDIDRFEIFRVVNFQIKMMMKKNKYQEYGIDRKFFIPGKTVQEEVLNGNFILNIMKGFKTTMNHYSGGPKLLIDCCCKIVREYDLWQEIQWYKNEMGMSLDKVLDQFILGRSFLTTYGN